MDQEDLSPSIIQLLRLMGSSTYLPMEVVVGVLGVVEESDFIIINGTKFKLFWAVSIFSLRQREELDVMEG